MPLSIFKPKSERILDAVIADLDQYLANNYKDQAHSMLSKLRDTADELHASGKLKDAAYDKYRKIYEKYAETMKNYNHREFYKS